MGMDVYAVLQNDNAICLGRATSPVRIAMLDRKIAQPELYTDPDGSKHECFPDHVTVTDRFEIGETFLILRRTGVWNPRTFGFKDSKGVDVTPDQVKEVYVA